MHQPQQLHLHQRSSADQAIALVAQAGRLQPRLPVQPDEARKGRTRVLPSKKSHNGSKGPAIGQW